MSKKIGNWLGFFFWALLEAQSVSVNVKPERIIFGESAGYYVTVKDIKDPSPPPLPDSPDLEIQELPKSSNSRQFINFGPNGLVQEEFYETTFRYLIKPKKTGQCLIPGFTYTHEDFSYVVPPILIHVEKDAPGNKYVDIVLKTIPEEPIYLGQPFSIQIVVTSKKKLPPDNCTIDANWIVDLPNFLVGDTKLPPKGKAFDVLLDVPNMRRGDRIFFERDILNQTGETLYQYTFQQDYIPMSAGTHQIPPCLLRCAGLFDDTRGRWVDLKVIKPSNPLEIQIQEAPAEGRPESYSGAIGTFTFDATLEKTEVQLGEALILRMKIRGVGNLKTMGIPKIPEHPNFKYYPPKMEIKDIGKTYEQEATLLAEFVPKTTGTYSLPPIPFTYFDIQKKTYQTLTGPSFEVKIHKSEAGKVEVGGTTSEKNYQEIKTGVQYIKEDLRLLKHQNYLFKNLLYWLSYPGILVLYIALTLRRRFLQRYSGNESLKIKDNAYKKARSRLAQLQNSTSVSELAEIFVTFLSEKLIRPIGTVNPRQIVTPLTQHHIQTETIQQITKLLEEIEFSRFGGAPVENLNTRVSTLINDLEKRL